MSEFCDLNLVKPDDFFTDFGMARVSLTLYDSRNSGWLRCINYPHGIKIPSAQTDAPSGENFFPDFSLKWIVFWSGLRVLNEKVTILGGSREKMHGFELRASLFYGGSLLLFCILIILLIFSHVLLKIVPLEDQFVDFDSIKLWLCSIRLDKSNHKNIESLVSSDSFFNGNPVYSQRQPRWEDQLE